METRVTDIYFGFAAILLAMNGVTEQATESNFAGRRWSVALVLTNLIGAVIYLFASSHGWVDPRTPDVVTGEPFIWAMAVFPIWGFFILLNLTWGTFVVVRKQWRSGRVWLLTIPIWAVAAAIDFAHH